MTRSDIDDRFANLELEPYKVPGPPTLPGIESVDDLYKGQFTGFRDLSSVRAAIPELSARVDKVPLHTPDGRRMPGAYGTVRSMPDGSTQGLGMVGERYTVIQDEEAFRVMQPLIDRGLVGTLTAGVYKAKSWLYGESGKFQADIMPGDTVESRVLVGNSHDGSIPWAFGFPGNRVVCQNTFHMALSNKLSKLLRVAHTASSTALIQQVIDATAVFGYEFVESVDKLKLMASRPIDDAGLKEYTGYVFSKWSDVDESDEVDQRESRVYAKVLENFQSGQGSQYSRGTLWGAFNAVTEYTSHQRSRSGDPQQVFADNNWGAGALINKRAYARALEMV